MKKYIYLGLNVVILSVSHAQTTTPNLQKIPLYETSSEIFMTDIQLRGIAGMVTFSKGSALGDSIFPLIKADWEKSLSSSFSQKEIKYLNDVFNSSLLKRYFKFQKDFSSPENITKLVNEKFKVKEIGSKPVSTQGK